MKKLFVLAILLMVVISACATPTPAPTAVPPTAVPPTAVPPTAVPPTAVPPTAVPPTAVPPTATPDVKADVTITFVNKASAGLGIFWVDLDGKEQPYGSVEAGASVDQPTHPTHVWRLRDPQGKQIVEYTATGDAKQTVTVAADAVSLQQYFTDDFQNGLTSAWQQAIFGEGAKQADKLKVTTSKDGATFEINAKNMYVYEFYSPIDYDDARIEVSVTNRGVNSQQVSLVCRSSESGWYEINIQSDGTWYLNSFDSSGYKALAQGGSTAVKTGADTNEYRMDCVGDEIHAYVNSQELKGLSGVKATAFKSGWIGFGVSSLNALPVVLDVAWFKVSKP
jgi:hypothetical protein